MIVDRPQWSLFDRDRAEDILIIDRFLTLLGRNLARSGNVPVVLETGVCDGGSSALFLTHPSRPFLISYSYHHNKSCPQSRPPEEAGRWAKAVCGVPSRWNLISQDSTTADWKASLTQFFRDRVDMVFVDGNHMDPHVRIDAEKAAAIVSPFGCILFDDFEEAPVQRAAERAAELLNVPHAIRLTHKLGVVFTPGWHTP